ncbi:MAG: hypothetical protein H7066_17365, partial [Cytophagaceae bacterium]|nr:hypothetical protein [Gemmatimonadaceae bacterium]
MTMERLDRVASRFRPAYRDATFSPKHCVSTPFASKPMRSYLLIPMLAWTIPAAAGAQGRPTLTPADYGKWETLGAAS